MSPAAMTPLPILNAAAGAAGWLAGQGVQVSACALTPSGFRLEGERAGARLVVDVLFKASPIPEVASGQRAYATVQIGKRAKHFHVDSTDYTGAAVAAIRGGLR